MFFRYICRPVVDNSRNGGWLQTYKEMMTIQNIKDTISGMEPQARLEWVDTQLSQPQADSVVTAYLLAERGKALWRMDRRGEAISAYEQGAQLDPEGPAAMLLDHSREIMDFFNPDLLNP